MKINPAANLKPTRAPSVLENKRPLIISLVNANRNLYKVPGTTTWLHKLTKYLATKALTKRVLILDILPLSDEFRLHKRSVKEQKDFQLHLLEMLVQVEDGMGALWKEALKKVIENYNGIHVLSLGIDIEPIATQVIKYLPKILDQLGNEYDVILIDLPDLFYPHVIKVAVLSDYWLTPFLAADKGAIDCICSINAIFRKLSISDRPSDMVGIIIPIFTGRNPAEYLKDLAKMNWIFGASRVWPFIANSNYYKVLNRLLDKKNKSINYGHEATFEKVLKLINRPCLSYRSNPEIIARRTQLLLFLDDYYGKFPRKDVIEKIARTSFSPEVKLVKIFSSVQEISKKQREAASKINTTTADRLVNKLQMRANILSCDVFLLMLDMGNSKELSAMLDDIANSKKLSRKQVGLILGVSDHIVRYDAEEISLIKDHTRSECTIEPEE